MKTTIGRAIIEFRNNSNGYYGGDISLNTKDTSRIKWIRLTNDYQGQKIIVCKGGVIPALFCV